MTFEPLRVTAHMERELALPSGALALDALLAAAVALRDNLPPAFTSAELTPIEVPLMREPGGRFHLASFSIAEWDAHSLRWVNRRFPVAEAQAFGEAKLRRIQITSGPCKSYRLPLHMSYAKDDVIDWYVIGDAAEIEALLGLIRYLGKRRAVGYGRVSRWTVEPCEAWPGFPVLRDGQPLRPLPPDWPGLAACETAYHPLSYPYDKRNRERPLCAIPARAA